MMIRSKLFRYVALIALMGMMNGCGGGTSSSPGFVQSGKLVQGPVSGARIFADRVDAGVRFVEDGGEIATTTLADGSYTLPTLPTYNYILVSTGGTDLLTNMPAIQMFAPAGSKNITPLTTLVALDSTNPTLDSTKGVIAKLKAAGVDYDTDISENSSPAVLLLVKSIETATKSLADALNTGSPTRKAYIQARIMQAIALSVAAPGTTVADLSTPSALTTKLTAALGVAVTNILADNSNITFTTPGDAATITSIVAANSVTAAVKSLGNPPQSSPLSTTTVQKEATLLDAAATFLNAVANTVTAIITSSITIVSTPDPVSPPTITVVTVPISIIVTGATGSTGSSGTGAQF